MNFNSPIPRALQPFFNEGSGLRSVRDSDALGRQWSKNSDVSAQLQGVLRVLEKQQRDINRIRRRILPSIQSSTEPFWPFKVYQPTNLAAYIGMTVPMFTQPNEPVSVPVYPTFGQPVSCVVTDANTPTNLAANPPTVSIADTWRFFCVRSGVVEFRPIYSLPNFDGSFIGLEIPLNAENWALKFFSGSSIGVENYIANTDGIGAWIPSTTFDEDIKNLPSGTIPNVCVIGVNPSGQGMGVQLWIQITPDTTTTNASMALWGIVQDFSGNHAWYASGSNIIQVAEIYYDSNNDFFPYQFLFDHVNSRYNPGDGNFNPGQGTQEQFRGVFEGDPVGIGGAGFPSDLTSQLFYPGDVVEVTQFGDIAGEFCPVVVRLLFTGQSPAFISDWNNYDVQAITLNDNSSPFDVTWQDSNWTVIGAAPDPSTVYNALLSLGWTNPL